MYHLGIDIVEIPRIQAAIDRWGERFLRRVYTDVELALYGGRVHELAVRFAAKEAVMKALGTGNRGVAWREIEVLPNWRHRPMVLLQGRAQRRAEELGIEELAVSLSHSRKYAVATAMGGSA